MSVVALVGDLMDRSKLPAGTRAVGRADALAGAAAEAGAAVVVVDLGRPGAAGAIADVRAALPEVRIVAFGRHTDTEALAAARRAGADRVLARSAFFADVAAALAQPGDS